VKTDQKLDMNHHDLLICKRLLQEGKSYSRRGDSFSAGLATSLLQDSTELCLRAIIKKHSIDMKKRPGFEDCLQAISEAGLLIPYKERIREVNTARVGFKHSGICPAPDEAHRYCLDIEEFLREAMQVHFGLNYDSISMVDLILYGDVRDELKALESQRLGNRYFDATESLAKAKELLFRRLDSLLPRPDHRPESSARFLNSIRDFVVASILQIPMEDYVFLESKLSRVRVHRMDDGSVSVISGQNFNLSDEDTSRIMSILVEASIQMARHFKDGAPSESLLGNS
jgi:hypothetical protein